VIPPSRTERGKDGAPGWRDPSASLRVGFRRYGRFSAACDPTLPHRTREGWGTRESRAQLSDRVGHSSPGNLFRPFSFMAGY
jgi:hypothetical protein